MAPLPRARLSPRISIAKLVPAARVIPVALRYEPSATPLPRLFIDIAAAMPATRLRRPMRP